MFKNISKKRLTILLVSLLSVVAISVGITLAYIFTDTDPVENEFQPSKVACAVVENGSDAENTDSTVNTGIAKTDVQIKNTGDTDAYIRVAVVVTWKKADGTVWAQAPVENTDYSMTVDLANGWFEKDGYYYYDSKISPDKLTSVLINHAEVLKAAPKEDYQLSIEIVASAIQAKPTTVVAEQWGVKVADDGTISK